MRKGRDGEKKTTKNGKNGGGKKKKKKKIRMKLVATTLLPAVDRPNADRWNAARSRQYVHVYCSGGSLHNLSCVVPLCLGRCAQGMEGRGWWWVGGVVVVVVVESYFCVKLWHAKLTQFSLT